MTKAAYGVWGCLGMSGDGNSYLCIGLKGNPVVSVNENGMLQMIHQFQMSGLSDQVSKCAKKECVLM